MRPVRALDRQGQGLTVFFIAVFAIPPIALLIGIMSDQSFWLKFLSMAPLIFLPSLMREPLRRLALAPRFVAWFCIGVTAFAFFIVGRGESFNLGIAAGCGLALGVLEFLTERFGRKEERERG
jgi:hypothetical protein